LKSRAVARASSSSSDEEPSGRQQERTSSVFISMVIVSNVVEVCKRYGSLRAEARRGAALGARAAHGLDPDDEAARWLREHDPPPEPAQPKRLLKSKAMHRFREQQRKGASAEAPRPGRPRRPRPRSLRRRAAAAQQGPGSAPRADERERGGRVGGGDPRDGRTPRGHAREPPDEERPADRRDPATSGIAGGTWNRRASGRNSATRIRPAPAQ
jgi:hypothetical protein